jgi:branched-chain amino acid transport system ATP-binding protein
MTMLEVDNVHAFYGQIEALKGISLTVDEGEIVTLIGANGAGKSTTLKTISGLLRPRQGAVRFNGQDLRAVPAHKIVDQGIVQVPEGRRVFGRLTDMENLEMGAFSRSDPQGIDKSMERVFGLFPRLKERRGQVAGTLSGGEQQMLATGRALMASPQVLLMDEPSMGLAPVLVDSIFQTIEELHGSGTTILLVEQNARMALQVADRGYVMQSGEIVLSGSAEDLRADETVRKAYLGIE